MALSSSYESTEVFAAPSVCDTNLICARAPSVRYDIRRKIALKQACGYYGQRNLS